MAIQSLGYIGIVSSAIDEWRGFATRLLGMQGIEDRKGLVRFRMDDRTQRLLVMDQSDTSQSFFGWEVADSAALQAIADRIALTGAPVKQGSKAFTLERGVSDLIISMDPAGHRIEIFHGPMLADTPFRPGRAISGFRTGALGMGHAVLKVKNFEESARFYQAILGFHLSDYIVVPFRASFFHVNKRHHSLALIESEETGIHHIMVEHFMLDDVGQAYDLAQRQAGRIGTTLGRHVNDHMTSFYSWTPSDFLWEIGWGGRTIDPEAWSPHERHEGPSLWGHDRLWLSQAKQDEAYDLRVRMASLGHREPVNVLSGNHRQSD